MDKVAHCRHGRPGLAVRPYADLIQQRRQAAGLPYADQNLKYQEAGHLIGPPYHPTNHPPRSAVYVVRSAAATTRRDPARVRLLTVRPGS